MKLIAFLVLWLTLSVANAQDITVMPAGLALPGARFYFKGESHEYPAENAEGLMALVKYLHQHNNVRYLVMECGPDQAYLANYYLQNGTDSFPEKAKLYLRDAFWKKLYAFNQSLPEEQRLIVCGFDFNRYIHTSKAIKSMLRGKAPFNNNLQDALEKVMGWDTVAWNFSLQEAFAKDLATLKESGKGREEEIKQVLGKDYPVYQSILNNITPSTPQVKRDKEMVKQLLDQLPLLTKGNFLLNYGIAHTFLDGVGAAHILSAHKEFKNQVCSIYPFYVRVNKPKTLVNIESKLSKEFHKNASSFPDHTLIRLDEAEKFSKAQLVLLMK